ncbi:MAG: hemerythrin [Chloroflexi bacterium 44-23]|nr:MAG: hemerythrin [Chloroflexi bacterium 44-23]
MSNEDELDIRSVHPSQRHPMIFEKFDNLAKGEKFVLINDHDPKPLYYQFQAERTGTFGWDYLESGPKTWRVQISRK